MKVITDYPEDTNTLSGRLVIFLNDQGIKPSKLAQMIDRNQSTISAILKGGSPTGTTLELIKNVFPELNLDWLLSGKGIMKIIGENKVQNIEVQEPVKEKSGISEKDYWILYGENKILSRENDWYKEKFLDVLNKIEQKALKPSPQEQAAGQVSQSADSRGNIVAKKPLSDETKKAIEEGIKKRNELIIDPGGQKE